MTQGIYISAMTPQSGKTLVALGLTDTMFKRTDALGFFRPVFDGAAPEDDSVLQLMKRTFDLPDSRCRGAVSLEHCREILASGEHDEVTGAQQRRQAPPEGRRRVGVRQEQAHAVCPVTASPARSASSWGSMPRGRSSSPRIASVTAAGRSSWSR